MLQTEKYNRRPFSVEAAQVSFENYRDVAEWCKGTVVMQKTKMLGVETEVPAVRVEGQGDNRGKSFVASLGCYIVELKGSFRVYKPAQFEASFVKVEELVGETVLDMALKVAQFHCDECTNEAEHISHLQRFFVAQAQLAYVAPDEDNSSSPANFA
jgi:hypothetical protein